MNEQQRSAWDACVAMFGVAAAYGVLGMVVLPGLSGAPAVWLTAAVLLSMALLLAVPRLADPLTAAIGSRLVLLSLPAGPSITRSQALLLERLTSAGIQVLLVQAVLRRPLALVLGGDRSAASVEAGIAASALAIVLAGLVWLYQTGRPLVYAVALQLVDAAVPTIEAPLPATDPRQQSETTVVRGQPGGGTTTVRALPRGADTTVRAQADPEATLPRRGV